MYSREKISVFQLISPINSKLQIFQKYLTYILPGALGRDLTILTWKISKKRHRWRF
jgi:hypothetical protein